MNDQNILTEELRKILTPALKGTKKLEDHGERLLGKLAAIAFGEKMVRKYPFRTFEVSKDPSCLCATVVQRRRRNGQQ